MNKELFEALGALFIASVVAYLWASGEEWASVWIIAFAVIWNLKKTSNLES